MNILFKINTLIEKHSPIIGAFFMALPFILRHWGVL